MGAGYAMRAGMFFILRTKGKPMSIVTSLRQAVAEVDKNKPVANLRTVEQYLDQQVQYVRLYVLLLGIFGAIAAVLAAVGIYGVMSYSVAERTREIGIRMALGAKAGDVFKLVALRSLILFAAGLVLGLAGSVALTVSLVGAVRGDGDRSGNLRRGVGDAGGGRVDRVPGSHAAGGHGESDGGVALRIARIRSVFSTLQRASMFLADGWAWPRMGCGR
jgi:ABC-type antimicrobial peptide transport system permease subunit